MKKVSSNAKPRRNGRPPKRAAGTVPTRERLLAAAADAFIEYGFERATLVDVAERAGISAPAIYKHFGDKAELLLAAARWRLEAVASLSSTERPDPHGIAAMWLSADFARTRRLLLELHLAAAHESDVLDLLVDWHGDRAAIWIGSGAGSLDQVKAFYLLLMGLAQVDLLESLDVTRMALATQVDHMVSALFPNSPSA